jgi:hypothetical protein
MDGLSVFNGTTVNSPIYRTPGINGYGSSLLFNRSASQFVNVPTFRSLASRSFTVEMWFYGVGITSADHGFFGQYQAASASRSLHYQLRSNVLYLAFFNDDLAGTTTIQNNIWYHAAFVYDYSTSQQKIYLNGVLDAIRTSSGPYLGTSGAIVIGKTEQVSGGPNYFNG